MKTNHDQVENLLNQALEFKTEERAAFLAGACGSDKDLRAKVETLLQAHDEAAGFLPEARTVVVETKIQEGPGTVIGRYKLLQRIGEGGMGLVYMAEQEIPVRRRVALKIIKLGMDTRQVVARFEAERQALALMDHPNIARVLDGGATETDRPYFVMELVQGVPITEFCDKNKLPARERIRLFIQVCQAIQSAHQKGIIHRDIKPSNVLVTLHHGEPIPKVIDFGIAKATNQKLTEKTLFTNYATMMGTPAYMSPEQAEMSSMDIDTRTDVYSLGVLLYELLTGSTPFPEKRLRSLGYGEMQRVIVDEEPQRPSTRLTQLVVAADVRRLKHSSEASGPEMEAVGASSRRLLQLKELIKLLRGDLDWVVMRCLEKDRRRRYDTPNELVADIERHMKNEPVVARPPTVIYRFQKMVRRNKLVFSAASAIAAALVIGFCIATWSLVREREARKAAVEARASEETQRKIAVEKQIDAVEQHRLAEQHLYCSNMMLVQQALEESNWGGAMELLSRYIPGKPTNDSLVVRDLEVSRDLRGWEWRYFWRETQSEEIPDLGRIGGNSLAFSADGNILVSSGMGKIFVWSTNPNRKIAEFPQTNGVVQVAISSQGLLAAISKNEVKLWDLARHITPLAPLVHSEVPTSMAFSPDGLTLATLGATNVMLWHVPSRHAQPIDIVDGQRLAFSPDGRALAVTPKHTDELVLWDLVRNIEIRRLPSTRNDSTHGSLAFSPDGRFLAAAFGPGYLKVRIWDLVSPTGIIDLAGHTKGVFGAVFANGGKLLASAGGDQTIKLWDVATWTEVRTLRGHLDMVTRIAVSPNGETLASGDKSGRVKLWKVNAARESDTLRCFSGIKDTWPGTRAHWALASDGRHCLTANTNRTFTVWDTVTLQVISEEPTPCANLARVAIASSRLMALADGDGTIHVGSPGSFHRLSIPQDTATKADGTNVQSNVWGMVFSADGGKLAAFHSDSTVAVWETSNWQLITQFNGPQTDGGLLAVMAVLAFSPDSRLLAAGSTKGSSLVVWDLIVNRLKWRLPEQEGHFILDCAFSSAAEHIATAGSDGTVKLWNLTTQDTSSKPDIIGFKSGMQTTVAYSHDGRRLATSGDEDQSIRIWDTETWREVARLDGKFDFCHKLAFLPDGDTLVAASQRELRVWRAAKISETESVRSEK